MRYSAPHNAGVVKMLIDTLHKKCLQAEKLLFFYLKKPRSCIQLKLNTYEAHCFQYNCL